MKIDYISLGINRFHTYDESIQKVIDILEDEKTYSKLFINTIKDDIIPYEINKNIFKMEDEIWQTGRLDNNKNNNDGTLGNTYCSCRGLTVFPNGKIAAYCFHGKGTCVYWDINEFQKILMIKYFNSYNRRIYNGTATHGNYCEFNLIESEENDVKERTNRTKGMPFM